MYAYFVKVGFWLVKCTNNNFYCKFISKHNLLTYSDFNHWLKIL